MTDEATEAKKPEEKKPKEPTLKDRLIILAQSQFTPGRDTMGQGFLTPDNGPNVAMFGATAKEELAYALWNDTGMSPGRKPLDEAWFVIHGGLRKLPKTKLPMRVGTHAGSTIIDIGDESGRAIRLDRTGWEITPRSPMPFARTSVTMSMTDPVRGGSVDVLWDLVNVAPDHRRMFLGWMVATLVENIPHPIMTLRGEQGAAKSTAAKVVVRVLDPSAIDFSKPPKDEDRWDSSCAAHWVVAVDNVSKIPDWWSDDLCRAVTGVGSEKRKLYSDDDIHAKAFRRCIVLNGVTLSGMHRPDLLERTMAFDLDVPAERKTEEQVEAMISTLAPEILGGLLDLAVRVLDTELEEVPDLPRMADFVLLLHKLDAVLGPVGAGDMSAVDAYTEQLEELFEDSLTGDPVALEVITMMATRPTWIGTTEDLLKELELSKRTADLLWSPREVRQAGGWWPKTANELGNALTRAKALLRESGVEMFKERQTIDGTRKRVTRLIKTPSTDGTPGTPISHTCTPIEEKEEEVGVHIKEFGVPGVPGGQSVDSIQCPRCGRPTKADLVTSKVRCLDVACGFEDNGSFEVYPAGPFEQWLELPVEEGGLR